MINNKSEIEKEKTTGFYDDNIITAENLKIGDIVLSDENDNHKSNKNCSCLCWLAKR